MDRPVLSWGRSFRFEQTVQTLSRYQCPTAQDFANCQPVTFHGLGRSYGDVALNADGHLIKTQTNNDLISFDRSTGVLKAFSGLSFADLHKITIPAGWFVAVTPGTKFVTLGGAVANDVHGKNHHVAGSFGTCVQSLSLLRSNGERLLCSRDQNSEMFSATISGLGLTGYIEWVEIQLEPIKSSHLYVENMPYGDLDTFFNLSEQSADWPYTVAWIDCFSPIKKLGRGVFSRARFVQDGALEPKSSKAKFNIPFEMQSWCLNRWSISAFNSLYRHRPASRFKGVQSYEPFFYPLDSIGGWNKVYGRNGFFQHQSIIPSADGRTGVERLLKTVTDRGQGSFLAVLKVYGKERSPGLNSFPLEGVSLALDFPNRGQKTIDLLKDLDRIVLDYGGRMYPAKDALMSAETFKVGYPNWERLESLRDPKISSSFWRRVTH